MEIKTEYRVGNIVYLEHDNGRNEIVKKYPNMYYGKESDYEYHADSHYYTIPGNDCVNIHESCFKNEECAYTIADIVYDDGECDYYVKTIGTRPYETDEKEWMDYRNVMLYAIKHLEGDYEKENF